MLTIDEIKQLLFDKRTTKLIISVDTSGKPHVREIENVTQYGKEIVIPFFEERVESDSDQAPVIWFDRNVLLYLTHPETTPISLYLDPTHAVISGKEFSEASANYHDIYPNLRLTTIWKFLFTEEMDHTKRIRESDKQRDSINFKRISRSNASFTRRSTVGRY